MSCSGMTMKPKLTLAIAGLITIPIWGPPYLIYKFGKWVKTQINTTPKDEIEETIL